jgi:hypothetical protein
MIIAKLMRRCLESRDHGAQARQVPRYCEGRDYLLHRGRTSRGGGCDWWAQGYLGTVRPRGRGPTSVLPRDSSSSWSDKSALESSGCHALLPFHRTAPSLFAWVPTYTIGRWTTGRNYTFDTVEEEDIQRAAAATDGQGGGDTRISHSTKGPAAHLRPRQRNATPSE